jgi:signal transduction histidine kinase
MLAGLSILTLTLIIVLITSWTIARPIYRLIERTKKISAGDYEALERLDLPGTKEMALLTRSFSDTARSLHERSSYIRNFATHVSHELKTPLTSIRGAAELLDEHFDDMTKQERQRFLGNILDDSDRLKYLVSRLLELAQADSFTPTAEMSNLSVTLRDLQRRFQTDDFTIDIPQSPSVMVRMSGEVVEMILSNMIDNARQHGADNVIFELSRKGEGIELIVSDNGKGISKANRKKIFDPFFTTRREQGGTGIGLGIVRSVLENHKGSIRLDKCQQGTRFSLVLPGNMPNRI